MTPQPTPLLCPLCLHADAFPSPSDFEFWECGGCHANVVSFSILSQLLTLPFRMKIEDALEKALLAPSSPHPCPRCSEPSKPCKMGLTDITPFWCEGCRLFVFPPGAYKQLSTEKGVVKSDVLAPGAVPMAAGLHRERAFERHRGLFMILAFSALSFFGMYLKWGDEFLTYIGQVIMVVLEELEWLS